MMDDSTNLKQLHCPSKEVHNLHSRRIFISIAAGGHGIHTSPMLVPFMFPEAFRRARVRQPVAIHVCQKIVLACCLDDLRDVCVLRGEGAELVVGAIAEVRPGSETDILAEVHARWAR